MMKLAVRRVWVPLKIAKKKTKKNQFFLQFLETFFSVLQCFQPSIDFATASSNYWWDLLY